MVAALITAASLPRCEIVNGRRPIPWVRNSRGFFIEEDPVFQVIGIYVKSHFDRRNLEHAARQIMVALIRVA